MSLLASERDDGREVEPFNGEFALYEKFCNEHNSSARKAGIITSESFKEIMTDPTTVFITSGLRQTPVLVDVRHGSGLGYDTERSRALADSRETISILSVPISDLDQVQQRKALQAIAQSGPRAVFFADNAERDSAVLYQGLEDQGVRFYEKPLLDDRAGPEYQQASLSLFSIDVYPTVAHHAELHTLHDIQAHFDQFVYPAIEDRANACVLRSGDSFGEREQEELWMLYQDRFEYLGSQHPISMEDTKQDFLSLLTSPTTTVSIKYKENKPICFTYFTERFDQLYWLNLSYLQAESATANTFQIPLFFPGIVASRESKGYNAHEVIALFANEVAQVGAGCRIYFENTNLSEQYIPKIIYRAAVGRKEYTMTEPKKIDQTNYRLIELFPNEV